MVIGLCDPSTVPPDTNVTLAQLARQGLRIIAMAYRVCDEPMDVLLRSSQGQLEGTKGGNTSAHNSISNLEGMVMKDPKSNDDNDRETTGGTGGAQRGSSTGSPGGSSTGGTLVFLGLLSLTSLLKDDTCETIAHLKTADIHVNMITGDHVHTAIAVARDCGIILSVDSPYSTHTPTGRIQSER